MTWYKYNQKISSSNEKYRIKIDEKFHCLVINDISVDDVAVYSATLSDETISASLIVDEGSKL